MDKRIAKTNKAISDALLYLMESKPLARIEVSAIARRAKIDRKTFYSRFSTPEEAFSAIADSMVKDIAQGVCADMALLDAASGQKLTDSEEFELRLKLFLKRLGTLFEQDVQPHIRRNRNTSLESLYPFFIAPLLEQADKGLFGSFIRFHPKKPLMVSHVLISSLWLHGRWLSGGASYALAGQYDDLCQLLLHGIA